MARYLDRYGKIDIEDVKKGMRVRITQRRYRDGHDTWLTQEGDVKSIEYATELGPLTGKPMAPRVSTIQLVGWLVNRHIGAGWDVVSVEEALPPLPNNPGSVIETEDQQRTAVLMEICGVDEPPYKKWVWADGREGGPSDKQLHSARIIYVSPHYR